MRDVVGASISILCMIHCFLPIVLVSFGSTLGMHHVADSMHHDWLHFLLLTPIVGLLAFSLPKAYYRHGNLVPTIFAVVGISILAVALLVGGEAETLLTIFGSVFVISAHMLNRRSLKLTQSSTGELVTP